MLQDDEVEDLVGDVKLTESQKSITSNLYSVDFTDSSSDKNNSSGKETYVIDCDSDPSDAYDPSESTSIVNIFKQAMPDQQQHRDVDVQVQEQKKIISATTSHHYMAQDDCTQTSKTIIQLAETERSQGEFQAQIAVETQTTHHAKYSTFFMNENFKSYKLSEKHKDKQEDVSAMDTSGERCECDPHRGLGASYPNSGYLGEFSPSGTDNDDSPKREFDFPKRDSDSPKRELKDETLARRHYNSTNSEESSSFENDIDDLYKKLTKTIEIEMIEPRDLRCGVLTPLTEESTRKDSIIDITPHAYSIKNDNTDSSMVTSSYGINVKILPNNKTKVSSEGFKLPPIAKNASCPNSPKVSLLFTVNTPRLGSKSDAPLQCMFENEKGDYQKLDLKSYQYAAGENVEIRRIDGRGPEAKKKPSEVVHLPPIHEPHNSRLSSRREKDAGDQISINERLRELKPSSKVCCGASGLRKFRSPCSRREISPSHSTNSEDRNATDLAERGCETLCGELLRRLRSVNWVEVADVLEDIPRAMHKFWDVIPETRVQDLIRQVAVHIDSPRTQVARSACSTLAVILKSTAYIKKPEFNEALNALLTKTGSYNRALRRAANVALDALAAGLPAAHVAAALCHHGVGHKNPLVRCAGARLLVVCAAMAGGGRELLRSRPAVLAQARRTMLRSLSTLLNDRNTDARKYAERLYAMIRPLPNFEAFYLTDVEVEVASQQMKKYDQLLAQPSSSR